MFREITSFVKREGSIVVKKKAPKVIEPSVIEEVPIEEVIKEPEPVAQSRPLSPQSKALYYANLNGGN